MSNISIERKVNLTAAQIKELAGVMAHKLEDRYGLKFDWQADRALISGPGVKGQCLVQDGSLSLELKLGLLASAFKGKIEQEIHQYFERLDQEYVRATDAGDKA